MRHVERIGVRPHPAGSPDNLTVRRWLVSELAGLGLEPQLQPFEHGSLELANVVAEIPGTRPGGALLLVTHHDSVPDGPGAADAGSCVAALLEAARALRAGPPLRNDVILLFTDGEEAGLLGAKAFAAHHPWFRRARVALNFEARGNSGPVMMFETSDGNGELVRELGRALRRPLATSASVSVYRMLPNDTDFTVLRRAGLSGMNFAMMYGIAHYHTFRDTPAALDRRSLQDLGEQALSAARHFGNLDLEATMREPDVVYTAVWRRFLLRYPEQACSWLTLLAMAAAGAVVGVGLRRGLVSWRGLAAALSVWLGTTAVLVAALRSAWGAVVLLDLGAATEGWRLTLIDRVDPAFVAMTLVLVLGLHATTCLASRHLAPACFALGALVPWAALTVLATVTLTGFHYAFCAPLLLGSGVVALGLAPLRKRSLARLRGPAQLLLLSLVASLVGSIPRHFFAALVVEPVPALVLVALLHGLAVSYVVGSSAPAPCATP